MNIVDSFWIDSRSFVCTVEIADRLYVDVKAAFDEDDTNPLIYVMDNDDGTQLYDGKGNTYSMSKANQELVLKFVEGEVLNK